MTLSSTNNRNKIPLVVTTFVVSALTVISTFTPTAHGLSPNSSSRRMPKNKDGLQYKDRESNYYDNNSDGMSAEKDANGMFLAEDSYEWMFDEDGGIDDGQARIDDDEAAAEAIINSITANGDLLSQDWEDEVERAFQEKYAETYQNADASSYDTMEMEGEIEDGEELDDEEYYVDDDENSMRTNVPSFEVLKEWTEEYIELIDLAGGGMTRVSVGMQHTMHDAFVFTSPKVGPIGKQDFVRLMQHYNDNGLDLASAVPDLSVSYDGWHQDPDDPWR